MLQDAFKGWLLSQDHAAKSVRNHLAQCNWVEHRFGDLDHVFEKGSVDNLLNQLRLEPGRQNPLCAEIAGDCEDSLASYRASVTCYIRFRENKPRNAAPRTSTARSTARSTRQNAARWPRWELPSNEQLLQLAKITTPYVRFLAREIVCSLASALVVEIRR